MNVKKYTTLILLIVAWLTGAASASAASLSGADVMRKVLNAVESAQSLTFDMSAAVSGRNSNASLTVSGPKFVCNMAGIQVYYDGTTQWAYDPAAAEVSVSEPTADELAEVNPIAFMRDYSKNYTLSDVTSSQGRYTLTLTARRRSLFVRSATVTVNASDWMPATISASLSNGTTMQIVVRGVTRGNALPLATFRFDTARHPGVEVIDFR